MEILAFFLEVLKKLFVFICLYFVCVFFSQNDDFFRCAPVFVCFCFRVRFQFTFAKKPYETAAYTHQLESVVVPLTTSYFVAYFTSSDGLHLTPVNSFVQMSPCYRYIDEINKKNPEVRKSMFQKNLYKNQFHFPQNMQPELQEKQPEPKQQV